MIQSWEYRTFTVRLARGQGLDELDDYLNGFGNLGWDVHKVMVVDGAGGELLVIMRREADSADSVAGAAASNGTAAEVTA